MPTPLIFQERKLTFLDVACKYIVMTLHGRLIYN